MSNSPEARFGYVQGLDGLRLFAVSIVIVRHFEIVTILPGGFGVSVFFFISGFLITRLLLAEEKRREDHRIALGRFYTRRFIRLLPPLLLMGVVAVPALYLTDPHSFSGAQIALSFVYLGNLVKFGAPIFGWDPGYEAIEPLWSLAVEEHFYLLLPPALLLLRTRRSRIWLMGGAIFVPLVLRLLVYVAVEPQAADQFNYHFTFTRLDSMAWGVLLTLLLDARRLRLPTRASHGHLLVWGGGLLMILSMVHWSPIYEIAIKYTVQSLVIGIFFFGVMFAFEYEWLRRILENRVIVHLGRISYEMYLWHFPVLAVLLTVIGSRWIAVPLALLVTVIVSDVAYRLTTKRLQQVRRRFGAHPVA